MRQMWRFLGFGSMLLLLAAFVSNDALAQKKNKKAASDVGYPATDADYAKIKTVKTLTGTILSIDSADKSVTLRVETQHNEPNPNYKPPTFPKGSREYQMMQTLMNLQNAQMRAMAATNPRQQAQAMQLVQRDMMKFQQQNAQFMAQLAQASARASANPNNQPFKVVTDKKDYTFDVEDTAVFRKLFLPTEYDDTGNIKKYTDKEKADLKGTDKTKPGYKASIEEVQTNQEVKLHLTPPPKKKATTSKTDEEDDTPKKGTVNMLVMTKDMTAKDSSATDNKKKK